LGKRLGEVEGFKMSRAWTEAQRRLAGGVNSPVRAFKAVGGEPIFMKRGAGPFLFDRQGKRYIDYCLSWGAVLLGHADPKLVKAIQSQAASGTSFGTATEAETRLAGEIQKVFTGMEKIRLTSSGTEAVMSAIRLARGITGRDRIVKFEGCYHGHSDSLLVKAGSGLATFGAPDSKGVPQALAALTTVLPYNDTHALDVFFKKAPKAACVIVEPVAGNMGVVPAKKEFLEMLRKKTKENGSLLIFDEVISGFRVCHGGAQHLYDLQPDITVLGKIIGGGLPIGAFGARAQIMDALSPLGEVYQAGTLSGNPLSVAAGIRVLSALSKDFYQALNKKAGDFVDEARKILKDCAAITRAGSMFTIFFGSKAPENFSQVSACDQKMFKRFFHHLIQSGVYAPPSAFEASFLSAAHTPRELEKTLEAYKSFRP
jgi:glutamate-1-semialdehyde 2,1-aminomutase